MAIDDDASEGMGRRTDWAGRPSAPSWLDALVGRIEQLPCPTWLAFGVIAGASFAFIVLETALSSRGVFGQEPAYFAYGFVLFYPLGAYHFLKRGALTAWAAFQPVTDLDASEARRIQWELTTTPARPVAVITVASALGYTALMLASPHGLDLVGHQLPFVLMRFLSEAVWLVPASMVSSYLVFRQLRTVSRLHRSVVRVDLLEPAPLHALAKLTARGALVLLGFLLIGNVPLPNVSEGVRMTILLITLPFLGLVLAAFFVPLRGMHGRLEEERARLRSQISSRINATATTLHELVDGETLASPDAAASQRAQVRIDALSKALGSLLQEHAFVGRLSTWPWNLSTLSAVVSAVALPIVLFLVTRALERVVG